VSTVSHAIPGSHDHHLDQLAPRYQLGRVPGLDEDYVAVEEGAVVGVSLETKRSA
jgi:hypothetical protein